MDIVCRIHVPAKQGIFCTNCFVRHGNFAPCEGAWCEPCYKPLGIHNFPIWQKLDEDGELLEEEGNLLRFKEAPAGDHLMVPLQCGLCHLRNITLRNPDMDKDIDWKFLKIVRRANLNAFWNRESPTVNSNLQEGLRMERMMARLGLPCVTSVMGPCPWRTRSACWLQWPYWTGCWTNASTKILSSGTPSDA
jgi:hypothetical protein